MHGVNAVLGVEFVSHFDDAVCDGLCERTPLFNVGTFELKFFEKLNVFVDHVSDVNHGLISYTKFLHPYILTTPASSATCFSVSP